MKIFTKAELTETLTAIGLKHTDTVLIHSAASAIGDVEGGADGILDVFCDYFGDEGLLLMPAMTYTLIHPWDPQSERCMKCTVPQKYCFAYGLAADEVRRFHADMPTCIGKLPNLFLKRMDVVRSLSITSSVAALGNDAKDFTSGHELCESGCAVNSPWHKLMERNGKILMLGCGLDNMTFLHGISEWSRSEKYWSADFPMPTEVYDIDGSRVNSRERRPVCGYSGNFSKFEDKLLETGAIKRFRFGKAESISGDSRKIFEIVSKILEKKPETV